MLAAIMKNFRAHPLLVATLAFAAAFLASPATQAQTIPAPKPCYDFTGTGRTSFATATGGLQFNNQNPAQTPNQNNRDIVWRILSNPTGVEQTSIFGLSLVDSLTPGYYDGDNRADLAVYRQSDSAYFLRPSTAPNTLQRIQLGTTTDFSGREGDYDGDGRTDFTVVRDGGTNISWFYLRSSNNTLGAINFGLSGFTNGTGDYPIAGADYNGDGRDEITVIRRNANGETTYFAADSANGALVTAQQWGLFDSDFFVIGDYLGDRRADFAAFRAFQGGTNGTWFIRENGGSGVVIRSFGLTSLASVTDRPICGDYNGDGKQDIAIYRSANSTFYWLNSPGFDTFSALQTGQPGSFPIAGLKAF
ncbi:MAG TPA: VCBS repeat-containing protein [Pyrinomonadaceae bacterium]